MKLAVAGAVTILCQLIEMTIFYHSNNSMEKVAIVHVSLLNQYTVMVHNLSCVRFLYIPIDECFCQYITK